MFCDNIKEGMVTMCSTGPDLGTSNVILAVNSEGISIVTNTETVLLQLSYVEIMAVSQENSQ